MKTKMFFQVFDLSVRVLLCKKIMDSHEYFNLLANCLSQIFLDVLNILGIFRKIATLRSFFQPILEFLRLLWGITVYNNKRINHCLPRQTDKLTLTTAKTWFRTTNGDIAVQNNKRRHTFYNSKRRRHSLHQQSESLLFTTTNEDIIVSITV